MIANLQVQSCNSIANGIFANAGLMETDRDLIQSLTEYAGMSASEVARKAGLAVSTLTRPLNQPVKHRLSVPTLAKLKETYPGFPGFAKDADLPVVDGAQDYIPIEVLPSYAGMGGGGSGEGDIETGLVPRRLVVDELRAKPSDLLLLEARGQSMEPDFLHGDQVLIDKRDTNPVQPGSFALWDGDGYVIKLVERVPHRTGYYRVFSANGRYSAYEVEADAITILGRAGMVRAAALAALLLASAPNPAHAQPSDIFVGNGFFSDCNDTKAANFNSGFCLGFIVGLSTAKPPTTAQTIEDFRAKRGQVYCQPDRITNGQIFEITLDYIRRTPRYRHLRTEYLYILAMNEAYPCPNGATVNVHLDYGLLSYSSPAPQE